MANHGPPTLNTFDMICRNPPNKKNLQESKHCWEYVQYFQNQICFCEPVITAKNFYEWCK
jgi:hypothetical protein